MKRVLLILIAVALAGVTLAENYRIPVGEKAIYKVQWGLFSCGTITISCDDMPDEGLIRMRVRAKSNWLVSTVYPVDDTVDCFIDPKTRLSVRVEKNTSEGDLVCKDVLRLNRKTNTAQWDSESMNISTNYPIETGACDAVSFLYAFRTYEFTENQSRDFNLAVDTAMHGVTITAKGTAIKRVGEEGKMLCRKFLSVPKRNDLFVRKVPKEVWITDDARKIMAEMVVKIPVGNVHIKLDEYIGPKL